MGIKTIFECPVSKARTKPIESPLDDEGTFVSHVESTDPEMPKGWGRLTLDVVALTDYDEVLERRNKILDEAMRTVRMMAADSSNPDLAAQSRDGIDDGSVFRDIVARVDQDHPLPPKTVWRRLQYPVLSPEAINHLLRVMQDAGFVWSGE